MDTRPGEVSTHALNFKGIVVREIFKLQFVLKTSLGTKDDFKICFTNFHILRICPEVLWTLGQERSERFLLTLEGQQLERYIVKLQFVSETSLGTKHASQIFIFFEFVMRFYFLWTHGQERSESMLLTVKGQQLERFVYISLFRKHRWELKMISKFVSLIFTIFHNLY